MQVDAIYNRGNLEFARPLKLKHEQLRLMVEIPDDELLLEGTQVIATLLSKVNAILAPYQNLLAQASIHPQAKYQATWHVHLEEKHLVAHDYPDIWG